jgi:hypothetical protein
MWRSFVRLRAMTGTALRRNICVVIAWDRMPVLCDPIVGMRSYFAVNRTGTGTKRENAAGAFWIGSEGNDTGKGQSVSAWL